MALKEMKKTPTGWGSGYLNVDHISCEKISGTKLKCSIEPMTGKTEELTGTDVKFINVDYVYMSPQVVRGFRMGKYNLLACYVDSGIIICRPEKELN